MAPYVYPITKVIVTFDDTRDRLRRVASDWRRMDPISRSRTPRTRCTNSALLSPSDSFTVPSLLPSIPCRATLPLSRRYLPTGTSAVLPYSYDAAHRILFPY